MLSTVESTISSKRGIWKEFNPSFDRRLPAWARRSNPIVRRHLGIHWKVLPLESELLIRIVLVQVGLIAASLVIWHILPLLFTVLPVAMVLLPFAFFAYGRVLLNIGIYATRMIVDEQHNNTLALLRTTPITLPRILYSKAAASVWREIEDLSLIIIGAAILTLPVIGLQYATYWAFEELTLVSRAALVLGLVVSIVRLFIEPVMIAALAILVGSVVPVRTPALLSVAGISFFYFLLINLLRLLPMSPEMRVIVEFVLPVLLPLIITLGAFRLATFLLTRD